MAGRSSGEFRANEKWERVWTCGWDEQVMSKGGKVRGHLVES